MCEDERIHRMGRGQTFVEVTFTPGYKSRRHTSISSDASVLVVVNYDRFSEPLVSHVFVGTEVPGTESLLTQLRLGGSATVIGGNRVAAARANGMEIYDAATGFVVDTWDLGFQLDPLVADLNSTEVFAWADGRLYLVDVGEKVIRFDVAHSSRPYRVIVTKDNRHFLTISLDSTVAMYEVQGPVTVDDDLQTTPSVQISPNPASSTLRISSSSTMRIVRMIDMMGEQVFSMTGHSTEFLIEQLGRFAAGLYVLFVETDHGAVSELIGIYR